MKCLYFFTIVIMLTSCQSDALTQKAQLHFDEKGIVFPEELKHCVIIPGGGCAGCIAAGLEFFLSNERSFSNEQEENMIVFTKINSIKLLKRNIKGKKIEDYNAIIDSTNLYSLNIKENTYPIILYFNNGRIILADVQSPQTMALEKLKKEL
ncbi:MAG: hypothetical protein IK003_06315 [Prevotella sp.]|nr:hypothetical protein [Prevotella sp.]